jgi:arsenate reductase (thioredoxin)
MKREVCFLIGAGDSVLWSDASTSPLSLPDSRERWEAIWSRRADLVEIVHSHPLGPEQFSAEDISTMHALDDALGHRCRFSLVTPTQYLVRGAGDEALPAPAPPWVPSLRHASGLVDEKTDAAFGAWKLAGPTGDEVHRARLQLLADTLRAELTAKQHADILFVCTHNSRRSHLAQLLGLAAARRAALFDVQTFSGGTEVTALNPRALAALRRVGFEIADAEGANPHYEVRDPPAVMFSKKITDPPNPTSNFVAVMTCTEADAACPTVLGATKRISLPYEDPKVADGTPGEAERYDERVEQIGRDLVWVFDLVARK